MTASLSDFPRGGNYGMVRDEATGHRCSGVGDPCDRRAIVRVRLTDANGGVFERCAKHGEQEVTRIRWTDRRLCTVEPMLEDLSQSERESVTLFASTLNEWRPAPPAPRRVVPVVEDPFLDMIDRMVDRPFPPGEDD